eukprot:CAMPEP_0117697480 /NCGR_PEP_ID=MMETSP0804-20121206/29254_1 /TAXON_ID=1074897 /ORGANISM="Tetraselmis astigmatica, Strain CCMP880" /LENGTH=605 /DNA_ID=CAMNT_0005511739 /DNA_START=171 /DNA_END=1990 /DNA_ORIENTATION=-
MCSLTEELPENVFPLPTSPPFPVLPLPSSFPFHALGHHTLQVEEYLEKFSLEVLGGLSVDDSAALAGLKEGHWLTAGVDSPVIDWQSLWLKKLEGLGSKKAPLAGGTGWKSKFELEACVVTIKDACMIGCRGLIRPMVKQFWAGACDSHMFAVPGVRAVINHKWNTYARPFMIIQLLTYSTWLLCFTGFVMLMNLGSRPDPDTKAWHGPLYPSMACGLLSVSTAAALPFAVLEVQTMAQYGHMYFRKTVLTDILDILLIALHTAIVVLVALNGLWDPRVGGTVDIDVLIAVEATLLWAKLPYFFNGFKLGRYSPIETLEHVVWESRYMLLFILFMMFGFGLGYTTLFQRPGDEADEDFSGLWHSVVTMFIISQGLNVNINDMYGSHHGTMAVALFVIFEFFISIVMFNTLLSLMVGAFDKMKETTMGEVLRRRAELVDEVDCLLSFPGLTKTSWTPTYIHVLRLKHNPPGDQNLTQKISQLETRLAATEKQIMERLEDIAAAVAFLAHQQKTLAAGTEHPNMVWVQGIELWIQQQSPYLSRSLGIGALARVVSNCKPCQCRAYCFIGTDRRGCGGRDGRRAASLENLQSTSPQPSNIDRPSQRLR